MDDTAAVLDPETSTDEEAPEELTDQVEETEDEEASETETFTEEELEQRIEAARKETEERIRSEERERAETAAQAQARAQNHAYISQKAMAKLREQAKRAAELVTEKGLDPETVAQGLQDFHLKELITEVQSYTFGTVHESLAANFYGYLQKNWGDYKMSPEQAQKYAREVQSGVAERSYLALYEAMKDAILSTEVPKRLEEERKAAAEKNKKGEAVKNLQNPPRQAGPVKGGGGETAGSIASARAVLENPNSTLAQKEAAYKQLHGTLIER